MIRVCKVGFLHHACGDPTGGSTGVVLMQVSERSKRGLHIEGVVYARIHVVPKDHVLVEN
jgi:hypothetical protein